MAPQAPALDMAKFQDFMGKLVGDMGAAINASLVRLGDKLGLYRALASGGPQTPAELAKRTGTTERYVREWLNAQAGCGYVSYDAAAKKYFMSPEQALAFAEDGGPDVAGAYELMNAVNKAEARMLENFKSGKGLDWGEHDPCLFVGTERFFRPNYAQNLLSSWIPALEGAQAKLEKGATVADVGCGHGASTILMAKAYPKSKFVGYDAHPASIEAARKRAKDAGVANATFDVARAADFPDKKYDLVAFFDCLHDMGDPVGAAKHVRETLAPDGAWMIVEPFAHDDDHQNHNPIGRMFYAASTMLCVPASLAHEGAALGAQAGEKRLREVLTKAGFKRIRRAAETPLNIILEARP
jgi:ubiquinone/menaquinone biosynthesis C-methylase UbiE